MEIALYTAMDLTEADGVTEADVIRRAHALGYELIKFNGWTDADLGPSGMPGPRRAEATENRRKLKLICDSFPPELFISVFQVEKPMA